MRHCGVVVGQRAGGKSGNEQPDGWLKVIRQAAAYIVRYFPESL
jgi:hypothetical protein